MKNIIAIVLSTVAFGAQASPAFDNCMRKLEYLSSAAADTRVAVKNEYYYEPTSAYETFPNQLYMEDSGRTVVLYPERGAKRADYYGYFTNGVSINGVHINYTYIAMEKARKQADRCMVILDSEE